jgi:putative ABC transport system permease protein
MSFWQWLSALASRIAATIRGRRLDRDLEDELAFHLAMKQDRLTADGLPAEEAARHAERRLGNVTRLKEELREMWTFPSLESIGQDVAYALRGLRQQRGFTATVVVVLATVIGLNTTLFTVLAGIALRPWPGIADPSRVFRLYLADPSGLVAGMSLADARSLSRHATTLTGVAAMKNMPVRLGRTDEATASEALLVNGSFFDVLGVQMALGRGFVDTEDQPGSTVPVVVLSYAYWQRQLGGNPDAVGSTLTINDTVFTVIGIVSAAFGSAEPTYDKDLFLPIAALALLKPDDPSSLKLLYDANTCCVDVAVRLAPHATPTTADAELRVLASRFHSFSGSEASGIVLTSTEFLRQPGRADKTQALATAALLSVALLLVWLIACANVGNLLLSRAAARSGEIATRLALGASRARVVRQLVTEGLVLALLAAALGVVVAQYLPFIVFRIVAERGTVGFFPFNVAADALVFLYATALAAASCVVFALVPALQVTRADLIGSLKRRESLSPGGVRLRNLLLTLQVAVSIVLLVSAGLLIRGVQRQAGVFNPGFTVDGVTMAQFELPEGAYDRARATAFFEEVARAIRQLPVESTAFASHEPFSRYRHGTLFHLPGESRQQARQLLFLNVSAEYFPLLGIPLRNGRYFDPNDVGRPVVVINETMARRIWPGENPVGKTFFIRPPGPVDSMASREIVGVVADVRTSTATTILPMFYQPVRAGDDVFGHISRDPRASQAPTLLLKTTADVATEIQQIVTRLDSRARVLTSSLSASVENMMMTARVGPILAAILGIFALALTTVGAFGVFAYAVRQQRREIGIRMALGAAPAAVVRLVLTSHMRALAVGAGIGILGSMAASTVLQNRLHGLSPFDPLAYGAAAVLLVCCGLAATFVPMKRATNTNPVETLRDV